MAEGPVSNILDRSYNELADLYIAILGTNLFGVCVVQLEDGVDQELVNTGEGHVEAWPMPMKEQAAYRGTANTQRPERGIPTQDRNWFSQTSPPP